MVDRSAVRDVIHSALEDYDIDDIDLENALLSNLEELIHIFDDEAESEDLE